MTERVEKIEATVENKFDKADLEQVKAEINLTKSDIRLIQLK